MNQSGSSTGSRRNESGSGNDNANHRGHRGNKKNSTKQTGGQPKTPRYSSMTGVEILKYGSRESFIICKRQLFNYLCAQYGKSGRFLHNNAYVPIPPPDIAAINAEFPVADKIKNNILEGTILAYKKEVREWEVKKESIFGKMETMLDEEGEDRVKSHSGWQDAVDNQDPLKLWAVIVATHATGNSNASTTEGRQDAKLQYARLIQSDRATLLQFKNNFELAVRNMEIVGVTTIPPQDELAMDFLWKADKKRYGDFITQIKNNVRRGMEKYPDTVVKAYELLRNYVPPYKPNVGYDTGMSQPTAFMSGIEKMKKTRPCNICKQLGHWARECPNRGSSNYGDNSNNTTNNTNNNSMCDNRDTANAATNRQGSNTTNGGKKAGQGKKGKKGVTFYQEHDDDDEFIGMHSSALNSIKGSNRKQMFIYDTGATAHLVNNKELMVDMTKLSNPDQINGIAGSISAEHVGNMPVFGETHYHPEVPVNLISAAQVEKLYIVTRVQLQSYTIHVSDKLKIEFKYHKSGLYIALLTPLIKALIIRGEGMPCVDNTPRSDMDNAMVTVSANRAGFTNDEVKRADIALKLMQQLGYPSAGELAKALSSGAIVNCPITSQDVIRMIEIYGNEANLKGKMVDKGAVATVPQEIVAQVRTVQTMHCDIVYFDELPFLITVVKPLNLLLASDIAGSKKSCLVERAIKTQLVMLSDKGFEVSSINVDPEGNMVALTGKLDHIPVLPTGAGSHEPMVERAVRVMKERGRCILANVGYNMPKRLIKWLVFHICERTNSLPRSSGIGVSAREAFTGIKFDYKRDCKLMFGQYVGVYKNNTRKNDIRKPRSIGCIALNAIHNGRGSWRFYSIATGRIITSDRYVIIPTPDVVIDTMNALYQADLKKSYHEVDIQQLTHSDDESDESDQSMDDADADTTSRGVNTRQGKSPDHTDGIPAIERTHNGDNDKVDDLGNDYDGSDTDSEHSDMSNNDSDCDSDEDIEHVRSQMDDNHDEDDEYDSGIGSLLPIPSTHVVDTTTTVRDTVGGDHTSTHSEGESVLHISLQRGLKDYKATAQASLEQEVRQLVDKNVWKPMAMSELTLEEKKSMIRSSVFFKEKHDENNQFMKLKARLVAGGDQQCVDSIHDKSSPTVSTENILMILAIAAIEGREVQSIDIEGAYLEASIEGESVFMKLGKYVSDMIVSLYPKYAKFRCHDGCVVVKLLKALYGCVQSSLLWYKKLKEVMLAMGYTMNPTDHCVFNKCINGTQATVAVYVDDLLITHRDLSAMEDMVHDIKNQFTAIKRQMQNPFKHLGMNITKLTNGDIVVDMMQYTKECIKDWQVTGISKTPATTSLFKVNDDDTKLHAVGVKEFHSSTAKLLYLSKRTRPDIELVVSHLCSRVNDPGVEDWDKLDRLFRYLSGTINYGVKFNAGGKVDMVIYVDASYMCHNDCTSRTGIIIMMAGGVVSTESSKQRLVTKSSAEAELVGSCDGASKGLGAREFLIHQGHVLPSTIMMEDNSAVLDFIKAGKPTTKRSKHIKMRYFFVTQHVESGEITMKWCSTENMLADMLTKPLVGIQFYSIRERVIYRIV